MENKINLFWFRRDLRLQDNVGLSRALEEGLPVLPIFIFDTEILTDLPSSIDRRVDYIHQALESINSELKEHQSALLTFHSTISEAFEQLIEQYPINAVYTNRDYEPYALKRDEQIRALCAKNGIQFYDFKDQVIFEKDEIVKADGAPYTIYTPYANKWRSKLQEVPIEEYSIQSPTFYKTSNSKFHSLEEIGFQKSDLLFKQPNLDVSIIADYDKYRDYPAMNHTSQLGIALRFGTISIRKCVTFALEHNAVWLSELIWREFFMQILFHFPQVCTHSFKANYDAIKWRNDEDDFARWCKGETGYPIVDAGMKQLNATGFMHNRVRMIVASFLCKHLLIDWRWGEAYFAAKLNDYDLAANNGNWQWAAGCGCDAAPYFRVFNPTAQTLKFDKHLEYIKQWNPAYETTLATPIVEHNFARTRVLAAYKEALTAVH